MTYIIFKLQLLKKGKCIIFVNDIDRSYRLKLFLEQFHIRSCILNHELPVQTRVNVIEQFNRGIYEIVIASDEKNDIFPEAEDLDEKTGKDEVAEKKQSTGSSTEKNAQHRKKKRKASKHDREYGMSRGTFLQHVWRGKKALNSSMPHTPDLYAK